MMQLTMKVLDCENPNNISRFVGNQQQIFDTLEAIENNWPGVKQWNVWFNDTIFGRYRNLQHLHEMEVEEVEEETEEHMDATALSEHEELEALVRPVSSGDGVPDSTGCDEQRQATDPVEGAGTDADHTEPEHQADSEEGTDVSSHALEAEHECEDGATATQRPAIPLIKIGLRS
jgi:hypothetical protein